MKSLGECNGKERENPEEDWPIAVQVVCPES